jgi:hypothetical protein
VSVGTSALIVGRSAAVLALGALLLVTTAFAPGPVAAGCGTNWTSKTEPPPSIRVLRTKTGRVQEVGFRRYVAVVMASGEWPSGMPRALLEAGALATKQFGWYYTLKGNHVSSYKTKSGKCYDVRDDARDQVFRPETAEPTDKQKQARDTLWGLSLRKRGKFLLTGYRSGSAAKCASDADSWRLYAKSARDCAKRLDYDSEGILRAYYKPGLELVWAPGTGPPTEGPDETQDEDGAELAAHADLDAAPGSADEIVGGIAADISAWFRGFFAADE